MGQSTLGKYCKSLFFIPLYIARIRGFGLFRSFFNRVTTWRTFYCCETISRIKILIFKSTNVSDGSAGKTFARVGSELKGCTFLTGNTRRERLKNSAEK